MRTLTTSATARFVSNNAALISIVVLCIYFSIQAESFRTFRNFNFLLYTASPLIVTAIGMGFVVISGKLDISLGSISYVSIASAALLMDAGTVNTWVGVVIALLVGAAAGAANGFIIVGLRVNPLVATLGTLTIYRGIALILTESFEVALPGDLRAFGTNKFGDVFTVSLAMIFLVALMQLLLKRTTFGRRVVGIGNDEEVARKLGMRPHLTTFGVFVLAGVMAAIAGVISASQVGQVNTFIGRGVEFTAVAAVVLGGMSLFGGRGDMRSVILGAVLLELIRNGLIHTKANPFLFEFIVGVVIFVGMSLDALKSRTNRSLVRPLEESTGVASSHA